MKKLVNKIKRAGQSVWSDVAHEGWGGWTRSNRRAKKRLGPQGKARRGRGKAANMIRSLTSKIARSLRKHMGR